MYEVNGDQVAVILDNTEEKIKEGNKDETIKQDAKPSVYWFNSMPLHNASVIMMIILQFCRIFFCFSLFVMSISCSCCVFSKLFGLLQLWLMFMLGVTCYMDGENMPFVH